MAVGGAAANRRPRAQSRGRGVEVGWSSPQNKSGPSTTIGLPGASRHITGPHIQNISPSAPHNLCSDIMPYAPAESPGIDAFQRCSHGQRRKTPADVKIASRPRRMPSGVKSLAHRRGPAAVGPMHFPFPARRGLGRGSPSCRWLRRPPVAPTPGSDDASQASPRRSWAVHQSRITQPSSRVPLSGVLAKGYPLAGGFERPCEILT